MVSIGDFSDTICKILEKLGYNFERYEASTPYENEKGVNIIPPPLEFIKVKIEENKNVYIFGELVDINRWEEVIMFIEEYCYKGVEDGNIIFIFREDEKLPEDDDFNVHLKVSNNEELQQNIEKALKSIRYLNLLAFYNTGTIIVKVLDEENNPVPNATIFVRGNIPSFWEEVGKSDDNGEEKINVIKDVYYLKAKKKGYLPSPTISIEAPYLK